MHIDIKELSSELKLSPSILYQWVAQKRIPYIKLGRSVRFDRHEIDNWLTEKRVQSAERV
jgi:excisionase family DNA binding protein